MAKKKHISLYGALTGVLEHIISANEKGELKGIFGKPFELFSKYPYITEPAPLASKLLNTGVTIIVNTVEQSLYLLKFLFDIFTQVSGDVINFTTDQVKKLTAPSKPEPAKPASIAPAAPAVAAAAPVANAANVAPSRAPVEPSAPPPSPDSVSRSVSPSNSEGSEVSEEEEPVVPSRPRTPVPPSPSPSVSSSGSDGRFGDVAQICDSSKYGVPRNMRTGRPAVDPSTVLKHPHQNPDVRKDSISI